MANVNRPNGLTPIGTISGAPFNNNIRRRPVAAGNATAIFQGDAMILNDDGTVSPATSTGNLLGVCVGVVVNRSISATEQPGYLPASTAGYVYVCEGPDVLYEIQEDGTTTPMALTNIGSNGNLVYTVTGSTTTGRSGQQISSSNVIANDATPAVAQLRVHDIVQREDNAVGANARWVVRINQNVSQLGSVGL